MKILFLSRWYPYPPNNGSKIRIFNLLKGISAHHEIILLSFYNNHEDTPSVEDELHSICKEVRVVPWKQFSPKSIRAKIGFLRSTPRSFLDTFSPEIVRNIEQLISTHNFDLVIASQINMAAYGKYFNQTPAIFEEAEVGILFEQYKKTSSPIKRFRYWLTWTKHKRFLVSILKHLKSVTIVSQEEKDLLTEAIREHPKLKVIPNCIDITDYESINETPRPNSVIFTGAFTFEPNYEAMLWFVSDVLPKIQEKIPDAHLTITGNHGGRELPPTPNVTLTGFVDDIRPYIAHSMCSIVPILSGGGTRLKILEAMALGTPVIATTKGAEGLDLQAGEHILVADSAQGFANAVISVLRDPELHQKLSKRALHQVSEYYNWPRTIPTFLNLIDNTTQPS